MFGVLSHIYKNHIHKKMSYLKVRIYVKSKFNTLLLVYIVKWIVVFLICYQVSIIVWKMSKELIPFTTFQQPEKLTSSEPPLILLWNKYQLTGSRVYKTIFKRITSGQCEVRLQNYFVIIQKDVDTNNFVLSP